MEACPPPDRPVTVLRQHMPCETMLSLRFQLDAGHFAGSRLLCVSRDHSPQLLQAGEIPRNFCSCQTTRLDGLAPHSPLPSQPPWTLRPEGEELGTRLPRNAGEITSPTPLTPPPPLHGVSQCFPEFLPLISHMDQCPLLNASLIGFCLPIPPYA